MSSLNDTFAKYVKAHPREARSHFEIVDPTTWCVVRTGRRIPIVKRFLGWVGPFTFCIDGVSYDAYARSARCVESQQMFLEDWGISIPSEGEPVITDQGSGESVKGEVDATTFHNTFVKQVRLHPQEAKSHFDIVDSGVWRCLSEPLLLKGERKGWEGPFPFFLNGSEYYAYGRKDKWRSSAQAFLREWGFDDSGSTVNSAKSTRRGLSDAKAGIALSILIVCAVGGWLWYRSNSFGVRGRVNDSPQTVTPPPEAIEEFNKLYARVENRRLAHEAEKEKGMRVSATESKKTNRSASHRSDEPMSRKDDQTKADSNSQRKCQRKVPDREVLKKGTADANTTNEDSALDDISDIAMMPLLIGCITFVLTWIILRLIFRSAGASSGKK